MLVLVIGAGRVGSSVATSALRAGHTVSVLDEDPLSHERLDVDLVVAVTGDDEDNLLICQVAKEKYLCERIIARVNNPRNLEHFKLLGIQPAVSATDLILRLIEHEVPRYGLVHLLDLPEERLEIIELVVAEDAPGARRPCSPACGGAAAARPPRRRAPRAPSARRGTTAGPAAGRRPA